MTHLKISRQPKPYILLLTLILYQFAGMYSAIGDTLMPIIFSDDYIEYPAVAPTAVSATSDGTEKQATPSSSPKNRQQVLLLKQFDNDGNGEISADELEKMLETLQPPPPTRTQPLAEKNTEKNKPAKDTMIKQQLQDRTKQRFERLDFDKNGVISFDEINTRLYQKFITIDSDKDNLITPSEFQQHTLGGVKIKSQKQKQLIERLFSHRDKNKDGFIAFEELNPRLNTLIKRKDKNQDGLLSFEEF